MSWVFAGERVPLRRADAVDSAGVLVEARAMPLFTKTPMPRSNSRRTYVLALCLTAMTSMVLPACQKEAASPPQADAAVDAAEAPPPDGETEFKGKMARS